MDAKTFLVGHYEKMICGVVILLMGFLVFWGHRGSQAEAENTEVEGLLLQIQRNEQGSRPPNLPDLVYDKEAEEPFKAVPEGEQFRAWLPYARPYIHKTVKVVVVTAKDPVHRPPRIEEPIIARGSVTLTWGPAPENEAIEITGWTIERKVGEKGAWERTATALPFSTTSYEDVTVQPKTLYAYRVVSAARSTSSIPLAQEFVSLTSSDTGMVQTPRDVELVPMTVTDADFREEPPVEASAYIYVYKWNPKTGDWISRGYTVKVGEEIGGLEQVSGQAEPVDYRSGYVLKEAHNTTREVDVPGTGKKRMEPITEVVVVEQATGEAMRLNNVDNKAPTAVQRKPKAPGGEAGGAGKAGGDAAGGKPSGSDGASTDKGGAKDGGKGAKKGDDFFDDPEGK